MCYWFSVSLIAWGALSLIGLYWYPLHPSAAATFLLAAAIGCAANWLRNRTLHCAFTAPLFFVAGIVFLLSGMGLFTVVLELVLIYAYRASFRGVLSAHEKPTV